MSYIKTLFEKEPSSLILYHYTTQTGLCGIIDSKKLWATNVLYLNDTKELTYSRDLFKKILEGLDKENAIEKSILQKISILVQAYSLPSYIYVFSLSEKGDLLSQWRGYCHREQGYSIGFSFRALCSSIRECMLLPCVYDPIEQENIFRDFISCVITGSNNHLLGLSVDTDKLGLGRTLFGTEDKSFINWFFTLSSVIKDPSFHEEEEWRIIKHTLTNYPDIKFRNGKYCLIPYVEINFDSITFPNMLSEVIIGPTPYFDASKFSLQEKLFQKYFTERHIIKSSRIPFREW